ALCAVQQRSPTFFAPRSSLMSDNIFTDRPLRCCKTELLYHLLCRCVLPEAAGGLEVDVVFVDTDYSLDMLHLVSILDSKLSAADEAALRSCLSRLLFVHCYSSSQLLLTLHFLETTLSSRPALALILIDSISAFYWVDRCEGGAMEPVGVLFWTLAHSFSDFWLLLLHRDYRITVFATCHAIRRPGVPSSSSDSERSYLCRSWQRLVTHRLLCSRQEPGDNMQIFTVHCTTSSSRVKASWSSSFCVTEAGVEFLSEENKCAARQ
uniref:Rad51-like C-terminal domain-containing protein n=1 Tax=Neolamprologus brichardi TaxID=32507 RepID=A0A3Q4H3K2_NEOBR